MIPYLKTKKSVSPEYFDHNIREASDPYLWSFLISLYYKTKKSVSRCYFDTFIYVQYTQEELLIDDMTWFLHHMIPSHDSLCHIMMIWHPPHLPSYWRKQRTMRPKSPPHADLSTHVSSQYTREEFLIDTNRIAFLRTIRPKSPSHSAIDLTH